MRIRPETIIFFSAGSMSYAGILRKFGRNVSRIRRKQKRDLMLRLKRSDQSKAEGFRSQVKNLLGGSENRFVQRGA